MSKQANSRCDEFGFLLTICLIGFYLKLLMHKCYMNAGLDFCLDQTLSMYACFNPHRSAFVHITSCVHCSHPTRCPLCVQTCCYTDYIIHAVPFKVQVMRHRPVIVNIMRDVPHQDTQPENHCHLLLCMFKPFFFVNDLRLPSDESWAAALRRVYHKSTWDPQTKPFRLHITAMLRQGIAANEEPAKRRAAASAASASQTNSTEGERSQGEVFSSEYDAEDICTENVLLISRIGHAVIGLSTTSSAGASQLGSAKATLRHR